MGELGHPIRDGGGVTLQHQQIDFGERPLDPRGVEPLASGAQNLLYRRRLGPL